METVGIIAVIVACLLGWTLLSLVAAFVFGALIARAKRVNRQAEVSELLARDVELARSAQRARAAA